MKARAKRKTTIQNNQDKYLKTEKQDEFKQKSENSSNSASDADEENSDDFGSNCTGPAFVHPPKLKSFGNCMDFGMAKNEASYAQGKQARRTTENICYA